MVNDGNNKTEYTTWVTYFGILSPLVRLLMGLKVEKGFDAWMDGLKERAESLK